MQRKLHQEGRSFDHIAYPHLSHPAGVRGHYLMSFRVENEGLVVAGIKGVQKSHIHRTHTHKHTHLTVLSCPPFSATDGHDPMSRFAPVNQKLLSSSPPPPSFPHSLSPSIPRASLLHPGRSPSSAGTHCYRHIHKAIVG